MYRAKARARRRRHRRRRRRRRETNTLSDVEYCDGQIDYLENVVTPMFEAYSTFTSFSFRDEVLDRAGENLAAWREGVATAKHAETTAEMRWGGLYKFANPVVTHSLKPPGVIP